MRRDVNRKTENCYVCQTFRPKQKRPTKPQLPIDTIRFNPGECFQLDLYEINKKTFITCVDKVTGLMLSKKLKNKQNPQKALENMFLKINMPFMLQSDNGKNFTSKRFDKFCLKNNIRYSTSKKGKSGLQKGIFPTSFLQFPGLFRAKSH